MLHLEQDGEVQRAQMRALFWMAVFVFAWVYFFAPTPVPPPKGEPGAPPVPVSTEASREPAEAASTDIEGLPAAAETASGDDEILLLYRDLELVFTAIGGRLKQASVVLGNNGDETQELIPVPDAGTPLSEIAYPLGLRFADNFLGEALNSRRWEMKRDRDSLGVTFSIDLGNARITKTYSFALDMDYVLDLTVGYTNLEAKSRILGLEGKEPAYSLYWTPNVSSGDKSRFVQQEVVWRKDGFSERYPTPKWKVNGGEENPTRSIEPDWGAIKSAYFIVAMKPEFGEDISGWKGWTRGNVEAFDFGLSVPRFEAEPNETVEHGFRIYIGPRRVSSMTQAWDGLDSLQEIFDFWGFTSAAAFMNWFAALMLGMMNWFHDHVLANYGFGIIFVTVIVRTVMFPLTLKSMRSMKRMQKLAPEVQKIRDELADNQQEMQKRVMELYRERGVNPLGGCFPILLQMPVFIAFYRMLSNAFELRRADFIFWITDLSEPDRLFDLPFSIPMPFSTTGIDALNVLPILMGIAMVLSQKLMPASGPAQNPQQKIIMNVMPVLFAFICYTMPSGLNLYILTSTVLGIVQNYFIHVGDDEVKAKRKPPARRRKNFYAAAQVRKREMAKEARRDKQSKRRHAKDKTTPPPQKKR